MKHVIDLHAAPTLPLYQIAGRSREECKAAILHPIDWQVETHHRLGQIEWDPARITLYLFEDQQNEESIGLDGRVLRKRLEKMPILNANILDYLLAHPELIPEIWKGKFVYFWGTVYRASYGDLHIRYLRWQDDRGMGMGTGWYGSSHNVSSLFGYNSPAVVLVSGRI